MKSRKTASGPGRRHFLKVSFALGAGLTGAIALSACTGGALSPGLVARMDQAGASLNRGEALELINQFRKVRGAAPLAPDAALDAQAQQIASRYAASSRAPAKPGNDIVHMRLSAGYVNFAETFSGWRGSADDAAAIADPAATRAGLGVAYSANSAYGVHWVLLLGAPPTPVSAPTPAQR